MSLESYLRKLPLSGTVTSGVVGKSTAALAPELPDRLEAAVNAGSILSFSSDLDAASQTDVLHSTQFAQRAADKFDRFTESRAWYGQFNEVLENLGWVTEQYAFSAREQTQGRFKMDKAALEAIAAIATSNQLGAISASISALERLAADDGAIEVFDRYAASDLSGNFQIGAAQKGSTNDSVSLAMGGFFFRSTEKKVRFLFASWGGNDTIFWAAAQKLTLNKKIYSKSRHIVREQLGRSSMDFIRSIRLH